MAETSTADLRDETARRAHLAYVRQQLSSPVNAILGYTEMLLQEQADQAFTADVQRIHDAGRLALDLITELLDPARVRAAVDESELEAFGTHVRHELRNPANAVIGYSEMLLEELEETGPHPAGDDLRRIRQAGQDLVSEIEALLRFVETTAGHEPVPPPSDEAAAMIASVIETVRVADADRLRAVKLTGRLLVADDNEVNRSLLTRRLTRDGHEVLQAADGREALVLARRERPDLLLLDVMMPELNGFEVLREVKADEQLKDAPVIMISALSEMESIVQCIAAGADDYLTKPFDAVLLAARIGAGLERKRLRDSELHLLAQLRDSLDQLKALNQLKNDLTDMIVHDLRTPLTSIHSGLHTMELAVELDELGHDLLHMAMSGSQTLLGMINDLLDVSKMESGTMVLEYAPVAPSDVARAAVEQVAALSREYEQQIATDVPDELPVLDADSDKLRRILVNLLGNAIKFTPQGGAIQVRARRAGDLDGVRFEVADSGEGIPAEARSRIFEKFGQVETRKAGRKMSTGLGLTFCKLAVEAHGGEIDVDSELGRGSTFWFTIPRCRPRPA